MISKFSILNGVKYFSLGIFQNLLLKKKKKNALNILATLFGLSRGNLMECQKKILKI